MCVRNQVHHQQIHCGFTLIEIAVVLVILALITSLGFGVLRSIMSTGQLRQTSTALQNADIALTAFVTVAKRLPCPANATVLPTDPLYGKEAPCTAWTEENGVIPWATLGLPLSDVTDGYGSIITYRVHNVLTAANAMDYSDCDAAAATVTAAGTPSGCTACIAPPLTVGQIPSSCTKPSAAYANKGLKVASATSGVPVLADPGALIPTGAAYVLISHGANKAKSFNSQGGFNAAVGGDGENINGADQPVQTFYANAPYEDAAPPAHFDDSLLFPTVSIVATRAGLGPRAHVPN